MDGMEKDDLTIKHDTWTKEFYFECKTICLSEIMFVQNQKKN